MISAYFEKAILPAKERTKTQDIDEKIFKSLIKFSK